uniref:Uncharacterized protein n=2 Tax=Heterosigma akashiwo TaxID=2829 RepID=A0A7S3XYY5_HETAK
MLQRFGRTWVMRIKTKRTQIEKLEHIFYTHDLQIHDGKEFGAFSFQEFKGLLRKAGFPGLGDKFQCKLFDEWNDKADWMEAQQALGKKPAAGKPPEGPLAALKGAALLGGAPPGGRGGGSSTGAGQGPGGGGTGGGGSGQETKASKHWRGIRLYARYGFLWQDFGNKDRAMAANSEARRAPGAARRAFALLMVDRGLYVLGR